MKTKTILILLSIIFATIGIGNSLANEDWNFDPITGDRIYNDDSGGCNCAGLVTLIYGAIAAGLVSALASIVTLMQITRRVAG